MILVIGDFIGELLEKVWKEGEFGSSFQLDEYIVQLWRDIARFESKLKIEA